MNKQVAAIPAYCLKVAAYTLLFTLFTQLLPAQKVGLVLSGGGAKGAAHIGVIKALEENNVPIDYITGTSIGAIIGSLYAVGYSPDEMLELLLSDEFGYWQTGTVERDYIYFFKKPENTPDIAHFTVSISDSLQIKTNIFPQSLINPIQMNQAFMGLFAQATAKASWNFDNLFVPFRCVGSDIYNKKPIIFRNGDLGDAVRASMSFPLVFKPIWKDNVPLFDGGIYDNFPVNPMKEAFHPDFIFGCAVAGTHIEPSENIYNQLEMMVMQKTDYDVPEEEGMMLKFRFPGVSLLDFPRAQELMDIGYKRTLELIDSLKKRVPREVSADELTQRREDYKKSLPPLVFRHIHITGVNELQESYIKAQLQRDIDNVFSMEDFKRAYFKMLTYSKIKEIVPHAIYNRREKMFDLYLDVTISDDISIGFGGNVSSHQANQLFLGLGYQSISSFATDMNANFQVGNSFDGLMLNSRFYLSTILPTYINVQGVFSNKKYSENQFLFYEDLVPSIIKQKELYMSLRFGLPYKGRAKLEMGTSYGSLNDFYFQTTSLPSTGIRSFEHSGYNLLTTFAGVERNTLDYKQYPVSGRKWRLRATYVTGTENYLPPFNSSQKKFAGKMHTWWKIKGEWQHYQTINKSFNIGFRGEFVLSNKGLSSNYTASVLQAPAFTPTPHSDIVFNEAFRANQYLAAGLSPILKLSRIAHLRADLFCFAPLQEIKKETRLAGSGQYEYLPYYGKFMRAYQVMGEAALVIQLPFATLSLYANGYSHPKNNYNFGVNIGYLIFNPRMLD
jgi:NTE family protein